MPHKTHLSQNNANPKQQKSQSPAKNMKAQTRQQSHITHIIQRAALDPQSLTQEDMQQLHQTIGHQAVSRLLVQDNSQTQSGHISNQQQEETVNEKLTQAKGALGDTPAHQENHTSVPSTLKDGLGNLPQITQSHNTTTNPVQRAVSKVHVKTADETAEKEAQYRTVYVSHDYGEQIAKIRDDVPDGAFVKVGTLIKEKSDLYIEDANQEGLISYLLDPGKNACPQIFIGKMRYQDVEVEKYKRGDGGGWEKENVPETRGQEVLEPITLKYEELKPFLEPLLAVKEGKPLPEPPTRSGNPFGRFDEETPRPLERLTRALLSNILGPSFELRRMGKLSEQPSPACKEFNSVSQKFPICAGIKNLSKALRNRALFCDRRNF